MTPYFGGVGGNLPPCFRVRKTYPLLGYRFIIPPAGAFLFFSAAQGTNPARLLVFYSPSGHTR